jgi:hypothetical protein
VEYFEWDHPKALAKGQLNFFDYSVNKRFSSEPDVVKYGRTLIAKGSIQNLMCLNTTDSDSKGSIQNLKRSSTA